MGLGVWSMIYPRRELTGLSKMASTNLINYTELIIRLIVGLAFIAGKDSFARPDISMVIGVFFVVSAIMLMIIPRRWHAAYAVYWAQKITPIAVLLLMPLSILAVTNWTATFLFFYYRRI